MISCRNVTFGSLLFILRNGYDILLGLLYSMGEHKPSTLRGSLFSCDPCKQAVKEPYLEFALDCEEKECVVSP